MYTLGLHLGQKLETEFNREGFGLHDSSAVLLRDGEILAAIEEERLSRIKHCNFFPKRSIEFCLQQAGIGLEEVDSVAVNWSEYSMFLEALMHSYMDSSNKSLTAAEYVSRYFKLFFDCDIQRKIVYCPHHLAHAWSAFALSGFEESLVVVLDGDGPGEDARSLSGLIGHAKGKNFEKIVEIGAKDSLGNFYTSLIKLIGYDRFDEYKIMGLAPYGDPSRFMANFRALYTLEKDGKFSICDNPALEFWKQCRNQEGFRPLRRKGTEITQAHKDFAASLQAALEEMALHIIVNAQNQTNSGNLCLAGGVAHNCTLNGEIFKRKIFDDIFVQPAAHDAGGAIGAALFAANRKKELGNARLESLYFGSPTPPAAQVESELSSWGLAVEFRKSSNVCAETAALLAENAVIGWMQGRSEFGPRALGNRSILADPRPLENRNRVNRIIKKRESYRPFAPSVLDEYAHNYFEVGKNKHNFLFMNMISDVHLDKRGNLGAVTHVDGSARVQIVQRKTNPVYWSLINEFMKITGVPILLNTSFNNNVEPIVDSIQDSIACFLTTELTHLVIGDFIVHKNESINQCLPDYYLEISPSYRTTKGFVASSEGFIPNYSIEFNGSRYFAEVHAQLSENMFRVLTYHKRLKLSEVAGEMGIDVTEELLDEVMRLWERRIVRVVHS